MSSPSLVVVSEAKEIKIESRGLQSPADRHYKYPKPKIAYDDPNSLPQVVPPNQNNADDGEDGGDPIIGGPGGEGDADGGGDTNYNDSDTDNGVGGDGDVPFLPSDDWDDNKNNGNDNDADVDNDGQDGTTDQKGAGDDNGTDDQQGGQEGQDNESGGQEGSNQEGADQGGDDNGSGANDSGANDHDGQGDQEGEIGNNAGEGNNEEEGSVIKPGTGIGEDGADGQGENEGDGTDAVGEDDGRGGSNDMGVDVVDCQFTAGGLFVGIGDDVDAQARAIESVVAYDYEIDTDPPRTTVLGMGDESTALAMDLILDQVVIPHIEGEVTDCVLAELFEQCDHGSGASRRLLASDGALVLTAEERRRIAIVGVSKSEDDQLVYFGDCEPTDSNHLCDIVNGEVTLYHDDKNTVATEQDVTLLAIKKCLESDELLEDIQRLHPVVKEIRYRPVGAAIPGDDRFDTPINVPVDNRSLNSTTFAAMGAAVALVVVFLLAYRRSIGNDEEEEEDSGDEESNLDVVNVEKEIPDAVGLSKPPALDFDEISKKDVDDSIFTPSSTSDQSTAMTFDSSDISANKTPDVLTFQPNDSNLLGIPEDDDDDDDLDLLPKGSMDFGVC